MIRAFLRADTGTRFPTTIERRLCCAVTCQGCCGDRARQCQHGGLQAQVVSRLRGEYDGPRLHHPRPFPDSISFLPDSLTDVCLSSLRARSHLHVHVCFPGCALQYVAPLCCALVPLSIHILNPQPKVPEEMQLNVMKKQREMVLLEDSLHTMRSRFNSRFLSLRAIKREILATVAADNRRLREIDAELGGGGDGEGERSPGIKDVNQRPWRNDRRYCRPCELQPAITPGWPFGTVFCVRVFVSTVSTKASLSVVICAVVGGWHTESSTNSVPRTHLKRPQVSVSTPTRRSPAEAKITWLLSINASIRKFRAFYLRPMYVRHGVRLEAT